MKDYNLADQPDRSHVTRATEPDETHHSHVQFADPDRLAINYNVIYYCLLVSIQLLFFYFYNFVYKDVICLK